MGILAVFERIGTDRNGFFSETPYFSSVKPVLPRRNEMKPGPKSLRCPAFFMTFFRTGLDFFPERVMLYNRQAGLAKWLCSSFPSWPRRFDSGIPLHFFCPKIRHLFLNCFEYGGAASPPAGRRLFSAAILQPLKKSNPAEVSATLLPGYAAPPGMLLNPSCYRLSFSWKSLMAVWGFALPRLCFMSCPTKNCRTAVFPALYCST